jgi:hypothetical protein
MDGATADAAWSETVAGVLGGDRVILAWREQTAELIAAPDAAQRCLGRWRLGERAGVARASGADGARCDA